MIDLEQADLLLTTTRSVRKRLDFDRRVPDELIAECIEIALQAPTASNMQGWAFVVVTDQAKRDALGEIYRRGFGMLYSSMPDFGYAADDPRAISQVGVFDSATYLAERIQDASHLVIPCIEGRVEEAGAMIQASMYGSILPSAWSFMLAARARGLGSAWTTFHLMFEEEVRDLLGIPDHITQAALLPVAYYTGDDFKPARRLPASSLTHWDTWGQTR
ncbi:MAG: nitroreductase family protein [Acidimicrobiales bacterium]